DAVSGEQRGIPSVSVMTERFVSAAELMGQVLGAPDHPFVVIPHPISSATSPELDAAARIAAAQCVAILTGHATDHPAIHPAITP
ncbi:MAG: hypothetical protein AAGF91_06700, partial [Actinomycetota bacterium]